VTEAQRAAVFFVDGAWLAWMLTWIVLARETKPIRRQESVASRLLHLGPLGLAAAMLFLPGAMGLGYGPSILPRAPWMAFAGAGLVAAGLMFSVWARLVLAGNWSGTVTLKDSHELVRHGPYRLARHPIYTGMLLALFGTAVLIDAWMAVAAVLIVLAAFARKLRTEEMFLRDAFGDDYAAYVRAVPALVPGAGLFRRHDTRRR
jgi:protein-S-isoprenylcysteine O-methyltransferase Ste14